MTAEIYQLRDYQLKRDIARAEAELNKQAVEIANIALAELNKQAVEIANIAFPSVFGFPDVTQASTFHAPDQDAS